MKKLISDNGVLKEIDTNEITILTFLKRFTSEERIAIRNAAKINAVLEDFMFLLNSAQNVNLNSPELIEGMNLLVSAGLLTSERKTNIMS